jgi:hypothetical protein
MKLNPQITLSSSLRRCATCSLFDLSDSTDFFARYAHEVLTSFVSNHGFSVTPHHHLQTAWVATYTNGKGGRTIGINSEMDALPGIGHACGHNLIAIAGVAVACGIKAAMEKFAIDGKIVLLGTPGLYVCQIHFYRGIEWVMVHWCLAEEGGNGKDILLSKGAYEQMDVCLMQVVLCPCSHMGLRLIRFKVSPCSRTTIICELKQLTCPSAHRC